MLTGAGTRNAARAAPLGLALEASDSSRDRVCACRTQATPCSRVTRQANSSSWCRRFASGGRHS